MKNVLLIISIIGCLMTKAQIEKKYLNNETYNYQELNEAYQSLKNKYGDRIHIKEAGPSDFGLPIYLVTIYPEDNKEPVGLEQVPSILINNAIHPGESCGVDASLHLTEDILSGKIKLNAFVYIITAYNVGGMHNRRPNTRANQDGPISQGFRGNANNYDLNRDFTKSDALNTETFYKVFHSVKPQFFIDNHTTNGADYQYEQTLIFSAPEKFPASLKADVRDYRSSIFNGLLKEKVVAGNFVNIYGTTPDKGFAAFHETPIYSTGYTSLYNTFGIVSETHMLKSYKKRVEATYALMKVVIDYANKNGTGLKTKIENSLSDPLEEVTIAWEIDSTKVEQLDFKGFEYEYVPSEVTGTDRLRYTHKKKTYAIEYYNTYKPKVTVAMPEYYVVPKSWRHVLEKLNVNYISFNEARNVKVKAEAYRIVNYNTSKTVYEGRYPHRNIEVTKDTVDLTLDDRYVLVSTFQRSAKLIVHLLEPHAEGSLFSWNFFDPILQQKEWYSAYVFEDTAKQLLEEDAELKAKFELYKKENPSIQNNARAQLYFIYINSSYYEPTHNLYPVYRLMPP